ncbi:glycosyltransferase [Cobetia amphilecti]|uniref:Glycosyltransferase n=1 Tax=Cobetia amphilecti TaxID=1055104 RepID=A0ABT6UT04_9GAMM|nr:glycosyltransferase [Cobetia amphilecti]MDI5885847.1 glycosyltransferase [Cobetia amphilecti]
MVLPIRAYDENYIKRLHFINNDTLRKEDIEVVVVDDGSSSVYSQSIMDICRDNDFGYIKLETASCNFSVGRCRNVAAIMTSSDYIMFQDVDLVPCLGFYDDVISEINIQGLESNAAKFLMFGVIYLTQKSSHEFDSISKNKQKNFFLQKLFENDTSRIEKFSTGTSVNVYRRTYYLSKGGNDPEFNGWGFEDLEFNTRCIRELRYFPLPSEWLVDYKNFSTITAYRGWKSVYRLFGDLTFNKGILLFHIWHPVESSSNYMKEREENKKRFTKKMTSYAKHSHEPDPLINKARGYSLLFRDNAFTNNRDIAPLLGYVYLRSEFDFNEKSDFIKFINEKSIDRVMFHNPYSNAKMLELYKWCRDLGISYFVAERGALPGAVFYDPDGFNYDSNSYNPEKWDKEISIENANSLAQFIEEFKGGGATLEEQTARLGAEKLKKKLGIHYSKKILFVPFQRPDDTVIKYFAKENAINEFSDIVTSLPKSLGADWVVLYKKHPLEDEIALLDGCVAVHEYNIYDLVEACDAVFLVNSGCGVTGLVYNKPVFCFGSAFYCQNDIARKVNTSDELVELIHAEWKPNTEKISRFLSYLVNDFYSFGSMKTKQTLLETGKRMTATVDIKFSVIRNLTNTEYRLERYNAPCVNHNSILFDRYRNYKELNAPGNKIQNSSSVVSMKNTESALTVKSSPSLRRRRMNKFKNQPVQYLLDSKHYSLRKIGSFLSAINART